jgi:hypothetical protein
VEAAKMKRKPTRRKRNKLTLALLAPILILGFIVGWALYWIGQSGKTKAKQPNKPINRAPAKQNEVELIMIPKENEILAN